MSRLTSAQFQQLINNFLWSNYNKAITGDVLRQFIQNLKDSGAEALLKDGTSIQSAITDLQNSIPEAGTGGASNESQLKLISDIIDLGLTAEDTQYDYNRACVAIIKSLATALDGKMDKTAVTETFVAGPYKTNTAYLYNAAIPEYVSFSNPASDDPDIQAEGWYRLVANASAAQTPETNPEIWKYNGRKLGNIIISDVLGLTEALNNKLNKPATAVAGNVPVFNAAGQLVDSGLPPSTSSGLPSTWEADAAAIRALTTHSAGMDVGRYDTADIYEYDVTASAADDGDTYLKPTNVSGNGRWVKKKRFSVEGHGHATNQIHHLAALVKLALAANTDQGTINQAIDAFLAGTINTSAINDSTWVVSESRLAMLQKLADGTINIQGSALLVNIFAPPGVDTYLTDRSGWTGEQKNITAANYNGELGTPGRIRVLADGTVCYCISSTKGTSGQANGSATYYRNRAHDMLDPSNSQDAAVIAALLVEAGWDPATNVKVLTIPARKGTFYKDPSGYWYAGYDINGTNSYWWRTGTPAARSTNISAASHPTLTAHLLAYDFTSAVYTEVAGDETNTVRGQYFYDLATRKEFKKVTTTQWEKTI